MRLPAILTAGASWALLAGTAAAQVGAPVPGLPAAGLTVAGAATPSVGVRVRAIAEVGNEPTIPGGAPEQFRDKVGPVALINTQITGRLPLVEVSVEQGLIPQVGVRLSGEISQTIRDPITNPDLEDAFGKRQSWRLSGGSAQRPLFVPQIKDAFMVLADAERNGAIQMGQMRIPFGYDGFVTAFPPLAVAPEETPMTDLLGSVGAINYQPSTLARRHDIGVLVTGVSGNTRYFSGLFNGSGPNRLDDNGDKDFFARVDWLASPTEELGFSALVGNDIGYPGGLGPREASPTLAAPVRVFRRLFGVHSRFALLRLEIKGEWIEAFHFSQEPDRGFEAGPRRGWYVDVNGPLSEVDRLYVQYGNFHDPVTPEGRPYQSHQIALGAVHLFAPGLSWRSEAQYRWEYLGALPSLAGIDYAKYLTSVEWAL